MSRPRGTRQSVMNKRRRGFLAVFLPWLRRFGVVLVVAVALVWSGAWLYANGTFGRSKDWADNQVLAVTSRMGFTLKNVLVEGRVYSDPQTLLAIVNVEKGDPLFSFDPKAAQALLMQVGWVEAARVERRWPDTIYIGLKERVPLALWQADKTLKLLDTKGKVIETNHLERFSDLMIVMGEDAPAHTAELLENLKAEPALLSRVEFARRLGERRWDLVLKGGVTVKLPEADMGLALREVVKAQEDEAILDKNIVSLDLRETGRLIVQAKIGEAQAYRASLGMDAKTGNNI